MQAGRAGALRTRSLLPGARKRAGFLSFRRGFWMRLPALAGLRWRGAFSAAVLTRKRGPASGVQRNKRFTEVYGS